MVNIEIKDSVCVRGVKCSVYDPDATVPLCIKATIDQVTAVSQRTRFSAVIMSYVT